MPNAKILSEKQAIVAELTEKLQNAAAGVIVDYKGITVAEDTELRAKMREAGVDYFVMKNTLSRFAVKNAGLDELCDVLKGTTSIALCQGDPVAAAKVVSVKLFIFIVRWVCSVHVFIWQACAFVLSFDHILIFQILDALSFSFPGWHYS